MERAAPHHMPHRVLLLEANNQRRWIGSRVLPEMHIPPIGLMYLATFAQRKIPNLKFKIVETSLDCPDEESYLELLKRYQPELVGIRSINIFQEEVTQYAKLTKSWKNIPIVCGGPLASSMKGGLLEKVPEIDLLVNGEGEETFSEICRGVPWEEIPGVIYRETPERIKHTPPRPLIANLDTIPFPDYDLIDVDAYRETLSYTYNHRRQGVILSSRGCPFKCTYCLTFTGNNVRLRSANNILEEMILLEDKHEIQDFYFIDDIFNIHRKRCMEFFRKVVESGRQWRLYFVNGLRADLLDIELIDLMVAAGTTWVTYAVESGSDRIQKLIKKNMNLDHSLDMIRYTQSKGIVVNINTMYGFPTETPRDAQETLNWLSRLHQPSLLPYHFCLRGYEGCEIVDQATEAGWDTADFLEDNTLAYNAIPKGTPTFPKREMFQMVLQYHREFGLGNSTHVSRSMETLRRMGYTEADLKDMFTILMNRPIENVESILKNPASAQVGA